MNVRKQIRAFGLAALMTLPAAASYAAPVTTDFDGLAATTAFRTGTEDGFMITATGTAAVNNNYLTPASGANTIHHNTGGDASFSLRRLGFGDFTLTNFMVGSAFGGASPLTVLGYQDGVLVATDVFSSIPNGSYATLSAVNLSGRSLDNLLFRLGTAPAGPTVIDNIKLNTVDVPEPASLALFGAGLLAAGFGRRKKSKTA